jgi:putative CRISPR-associated protein (TIGR02619 family)
MKKVITTVGTSLFNEYKGYKSYLENNYDDRDEMQNQEIKASINKAIKNKLPNIKSISAELKSLLTYAEDAKEDIEVYFITTDTVASNLAAEILTDFLNNPPIQLKVNINPQATYRIENLNIDKFDKFEKGIDSLIKKISQLMDEIQKSYENKDFYKVRKKMRKDVVFNITGGYKGIIPMMTILAQLYECELLYIFENSQDKITIPRIPINFDPFLTEALYMDLVMVTANKKPYSPENETKLIEYGFYNKQNEITALGHLFMDMVEKNQPIAKNVVGIFMEFKILEYFYHIKKYNLFHSYQEKDKCELDFVEKINNHIFKIWEIKSATMFVKNNYQDIKEQIERQINQYSDVQEHELIIYSIKNNVTIVIENNVRNMYSDLKQEFPNIKFTAKILNISNMSIGKQDKNSNPYQPLLQSAINDSHFKTIQLEDNNE